MALGISTTFVQSGFKRKSCVLSVVLQVPSTSHLADERSVMTDQLVLMRTII